MRKWQRKSDNVNQETTTSRQHDTVHQIVLPQKCRLEVLQLAHDAMLAGHLGVSKTKDRILSHFYWPGIFKQVADYCRSCPVCQFIDKTKSPRKHPLCPLPVIQTPFKRIGIDIVGPFPRSLRRNKYLLTICDYATRYPEAIPLPNIRADTVSNALIQVFTRVGLPKEIVHDQGTNVMSNIMKNMCKNLGIQQIPTTPYHPQTNGLTERFHGTLKNMIKTLDEKQMRKWDEYIPPFLFAYREVPSQATGYSPFELLYGRKIRGPLTLIKEKWTTDEASSTDVVKYMIDMRRKIDNLMNKATENVAKSQTKMKENYDKTASARVFEPGDKVLLFLPLGNSKLESKWQGPFVILRKITDVNYEVMMPNKRKSKRIIHVNMMKLWYDKDHENAWQNACILLLMLNLSLFMIRMMCCGTRMMRTIVWT